jgi:RecB family exonuclease
MADLDHLSYSSVSSYLLCGHAWYLHYVQKVQTPTAPALVFGTAWHELTERYLRTGEPLEALWPGAWSKALERDADIDWSQESPEDLQATALRMVRAKPVADLLAQVRAAFDPERGAIERRVELHVPGVPVPIVGYIDVMTTDGIPGDFKTAARMWGDDKAAAEMQPLVYLAALNQAGEDTHQWRFRHYVMSKAAKPTAKVFTTQRTPGEVLGNLFPTIAQVWAGIQAGVFPKNTGSWKCSPKWCEHYAGCMG